MEAKLSQDGTVALQSDFSLVSSTANRIQQPPLFPWGLVSSSQDASALWGSLSNVVAMVITNSEQPKNPQNIVSNNKNKQHHALKTLHPFFFPK